MTTQIGPGTPSLRTNTGVDYSNGVTYKTSVTMKQLFRGCCGSLKKEKDATSVYVVLNQQIDELRTHSKIPCPSPSNLKKACQHFSTIQQKQGLETPYFHTQSEFSLLIAHGSGYLLLPLSTGSEKEIFVAVNFRSRQSIVVSKKDLENLDQIQVLTSDFNLLKNLASKQKDTGGLVPLFDQVVIGHSQFLMQLWCKGGDLCDYLQTYQIKPEQKGIFAADIFQGVSWLLENNFLLSDLKVENICLHEGRALIGDLNAIGTAETLSCAAPETILSQGETFTAKSISWSLGLVLYFLFCGRKATIAEELNGFSVALADHVKQGNDPTEFLAQVSADMLKDLLPWEQENYPGPQTQGEALVIKLLRFDPAQRMSVEEAYTQFETIPVSELSIQHREQPNESEATS